LTAISLTGYFLAVECRNDAKTVDVVKSNISITTGNYMVLIEKVQTYEKIPARFQLLRNGAYLGQGG